MGKYMIWMVHQMSWKGMLNIFNLIGWLNKLYNIINVPRIKKKKQQKNPQPNLLLHLMNKATVRQVAFIALG